jgi:glucokinase
MKVYALDIGGSSLKHAMIDVDDKGAEIITRFTPVQLPSNLFADLRGAVLSAAGSALRKDSNISTIAISTTGNVDQQGVVRRAGHFEGYENVSWREILSSELSTISRVTTVNDGKASTWAEFSASNEQCTAFAHIVVGTGIGGGIVLNGALYYGGEGTAGSFGHIKVCAQTDIRCSCTRVGCVETVASAPAIVRTFKRGIKGQASEPTHLDEVTLLAKAGDQTAVKAFAEAGTWLGIALSDVMNIFNPQVVTIGGGVVLAAESIDDGQDKNVFVEAVVQSAGSLALKRVVASTIIRKATYGNDSGLIGAALLAGRC